jgi:cytochrome c oxidase cbb3-type subunit IV
MFKNVVSEIGGVGVYGVVSICLFFAVFIGVIAWAMLLKKPFLKTMSDLPLQDGSTTSETKEHSHE